MNLLFDKERLDAQELIRLNHYAHSVPSCKSYYLAHEEAIVIWSIPANKNIAKFILGWNGEVWELSRLWAPDGHRPNLLTESISLATASHHCTRCDGPGPRPTGATCPECGCPTPRQGNRRALDR